MNLSQAGLKFIASFEGYHKALPDGRCQAYRCQIGNGKDDGVWTIGFGCTEGVYAGLVWTREQAEQAYLRELAKHEAAVNQLVTVPVTQNQYDALVSLSYNIGTGIGAKSQGLANSSILKKLNAGDPDGAARGFPLYNRSQGQVVSGLVRRRAEEAALFRRPDVQPSEPDMPQAVDPPAPKEVHLEAHAALAQTSWGYSLVGRGLQALRWAAPGGAIGLAGKKAMEGGAPDAGSVAPQATDLLGQVAAGAHLIAQYGLPFLGIALAGVLLLEAVRYWQRTYVVGGTK